MCIYINGFVKKKKREADNKTFLNSGISSE